MAQSRFTAFLQRVRLLVTGQPVQERRQELGHQFSTDAAPAGRLSHEFAVGNIAEVTISHTFTIPGIALTSGLQHEFIVSSLNKTSILTQQFNVDHLDKEKILAHTFSVPFTATSGLHHQFTGGLAATSGLNHEFNVPNITTTSGLHQQFNISEINTTATLRHSFGVEQTATSGLNHTFAVQQTTTATLEHQFNIPFINSGFNLSHEWNVDHIDATKILGHSFGMENTLEIVLAHSFGVNSEPQASGLQHEFGIYGILVQSGLQHEFNVPSISGQESILSHQFAVQLDSTGQIFHQFTLAYDATSVLEHEFLVSSLNKSTSIGHTFQMNANKSTLAHTFSAIGVAQVETTLSHQFNATYTVPSYVLQHQFNLVFSLPLPDPVVHSGEFKFIYDDSNDGNFGIHSGVNYSLSRAKSYSDPTVNPITSSGTWRGVDPGSVIPAVASGLNEADYLHGTFVFHNDTLVFSSGVFRTIPEYNSDTIFLRQAWTSPVVTSGYGAWWGINDFPIGLSNITLVPGETIFGPFFGRQLTISGFFDEKFGLFDPALQLTANISLTGGDPFVFNSYDLDGEVKLVLEKEFLISGIYVTKPNGTPGSVLKRGDTVARLGFTYHEEDYQPEELSWSLGVNTPPNVFDQTQSTDQWIVSGLHRDFTTTALQTGDDVRGRIRAFSPKKNTIFTGVYPSGLLAMSSSDLVNLWGGGILVWPDIGDIESTLDIEYTISGVGRGRIPTVITLKSEAVNGQPKVARFFRAETDFIQTTVLEVPVDAQHDDQFDSLRVVRDFDASIDVEFVPGNAAFTVYKPEGHNAVPKVIFAHEDSEGNTGEQEEPDIKRLFHTFGVTGTTVAGVSHEFNIDIIIISSLVESFEDWAGTIVNPDYPDDFEFTGGTLVESFEDWS